MKNNVDLESSFNSWDISIEKTLNTPKSAIFADSAFLDWAQVYSTHAKGILCMVSKQGTTTQKSLSIPPSFPYLPWIRKMKMSEV